LYAYNFEKTSILNPKEDEKEIFAIKKINRQQKQEREA